MCSLKSIFLFCFVLVLKIFIFFFFFQKISPLFHQSRLTPVGPKNLEIFYQCLSAL